MNLSKGFFHSAFRIARLLFFFAEGDSKWHGLSIFFFCGAVDRGLITTRLLQFPLVVEADYIIKLRPKLYYVHFTHYDYDLNQSRYEV